VQRFNLKIRLWDIVLYPVFQNSLHVCIPIKKLKKNHCMQKDKIPINEWAINLSFLFRESVGTVMNKTVGNLVAYIEATMWQLKS